ncbi:MAG: TonB-dependent receptor [Microbacteriaceae bacterium]|nr:TonB-dependent receptor [Burkholderiaceae bacterium]
MAFRSRLSLSPLTRHRWHPLAHAALLLAAWPAQSQTAADPTTQTVTVSGRNANVAVSLAGFGDVPLSRAPFSATVLDVGLMQDAGISGIADLTRLDAGITDAYNAPGYWGQLAVRGFTLDNRFNYRRDGLPIYAETAIAQANKQAIEILKGTSGLQAGTSAPGGLVNLVVKRPRERVQTATLGWEQDGSVNAAVDLGARDSGFGWRINASADQLNPRTYNSQGHRKMLAGAVELQPSAGSLLEAEFEWSRQTQPSTPGFSLLGNRLPDANRIDPRINLNNQPWTLPVVMQGQTASLRYTQALTDDLQLVAHVMRQRLDSDDRIAFPYGLYDPVSYSCAPCDRYASNGDFSVWDFRSEGERRTSDAGDVSINGRAVLASMAHRFNLGLTATRYQARFNRQAYNLVGVGNIDGRSQVPADPTLTDENTHRDERSTEWHLQDAITLSPRWTLWAGLRHSQLRRDSVRTDGSRPTQYSQGFTTPWLALSHTVDRQSTVYASWGQGVESEVAPNRSRYSNAGQALPALKSEQFEVGLKHSTDTLDWRLAAFDIQRPVWRDIGTCGDPDTCTRQADGNARHRGLEAEVDWRTGAWNLRGSAMALHARRAGSLDGAINGLRPTNVPANSLKAQAAYNVPALPGLAVLGFVTREGERMVLPDNSIATPGWTRLDLGLRYQWQAAGYRWLWRAGVDNLADHRAWKEAPYQYDHAYLYPLAPRTLHASIQMSL